MKADTVNGSSSREAQMDKTELKLRLARGQDVGYTILVGQKTLDR